MQAIQRPLVALAAIASIGLAGCAATTSPRYDARFGDAVRVMNVQQTLDPAATARNGSQPVQSDGRSAAEANGRYIESFKAPPVPPAPVFNVTGGSTGR